MSNKYNYNQKVANLKFVEFICNIIHYDWRVLVALNFFYFINKLVNNKTFYLNLYNTAIKMLIRIFFNEDILNMEISHFVIIIKVKIIKFE